MRLSDFIRSRTSELVQEWEKFARTCMPAASTMDEANLRDHVVEMLQFIADDMDTRQSDLQQAEKGKGRGPRSVADTEAEKHAVMRVADGFTMVAWPTKPRHARVVVLGLEGTAAKK